MDETIKEEFILVGKNIIEMDIKIIMLINFDHIFQEIPSQDHGWFVASLSDHTRHQLPPFRDHSSCNRPSSCQSSH